MADNTAPKSKSREEFEAELKRKRDELEAKRKKLSHQTGDNPDNGPSGGSDPAPQGNGGNPPDPGQNPPPPPQPNIPTEDYDESTKGVSSAYGLNPMAKDKKTPPTKSHSGTAKAPERKKNKYKPEDSKNFLQACYNEVLVAAYAGAIDFGVDLTLDILDYILFAPLSSSKSAEKKSDKKEKTVFDYADEIINENNEKGKGLIRSFLLHHKEIVDNVERVKSGQTPEWRVWQGQEPQCFSHLVEISTKAAADPNSPEAKEWNAFKNMPQEEVVARATDVNIANYAVHHVALTTKMTDVEPIPVDITKAFKNMQKMVENSQIDDNDLKNKISAEITSIRPHLTGNTPVNQEITEKLNEFVQVLLDPNCNREAIATKVVELQQIHPIKHELKEKAAALCQEIRQNLVEIDLAYADNPEQAKVAKEEYLKKIAESQKDAAIKQEKDANANFVKRRVGIGKHGRTKEQAENAINYAGNTMRHIRVPQNNQTTNPNRRPKKQIQNDTDIRGLINNVGMGL